MVPPRPVRRALLPLFAVLEIAVLVVAVMAAAVGVLLVAVDRRARVLRLAAMAGAYIVVELAALTALLGVWVARAWRPRERSDRADLRVVAWALGAILGAARRTVGLDMSVQEPPPESGSVALLAGPEPVLVLARHGGIGDSFSLVWLLAARYRRRPRIVLKDVLLWEPMIDVALSRMGACFLPPAARAGEELAARVAALAAGLEPGDVLLLFPEGGNWTPRRRLRAIGRLWAAGRPAAVRAAALMEHVLPPRVGGVMACLDARPDLPVAVFAHAGLDRITTAAAVWRSLPFARPMSVRWWLAAPAPEGEQDRLAWLTAEWAVVDQWIDAYWAQPA